MKEPKMISSIPKKPCKSITSPSSTYPHRAEKRGMKERKGTTSESGENLRAFIKNIEPAISRGSQNSVLRRSSFDISQNIRPKGNVSRAHRGNLIHRMKFSLYPFNILFLLKMSLVDQKKADKTAKSMPASVNLYSLYTSYYNCFLYCKI